MHNRWPAGRVCTDRETACVLPLPWLVPSQPSLARPAMGGLASCSVGCALTLGSLCTPLPTLNFLPVLASRLKTCSRPSLTAWLYCIGLPLLFKGCNTPLQRMRHSSFKGCDTLRSFVSAEWSVHAQAITTFAFAHSTPAPFLGNRCLALLPARNCSLQGSRAALMAAHFAVCCPVCCCYKKPRVDSHAGSKISRINSYQLIDIVKRGMCMMCNAHGSFR